MQDIRVTVDGREIVVSRRRMGKAIFAKVHDQEREPTLAEARAVIEATLGPGCREVWWWVPNRIPSNLRLKRCECGEVSFSETSCKLCRALAPLVTIVEPYSLADEQARFEAAERMLERVAKAADELRRRVMTGRVSGPDPK